MANKIINQEGTMCDVPGCEKFYFGERPKSWKTVSVTKIADDIYDACSVKHAKEIIATFVTIQ